MPDAADRPETGGPAPEPPGPASVPDDAPVSDMEADAAAGMDAAAVAGAGAKEAPKRGSAAALVAAGIFLSRTIGLVRERAVGYFFGLGPHADVLLVALKTPNFLQNLLGEGTISAAFIPVYSRMLEEGRPEAAGRFAGAVFGLLVALVAVVVGLGVLLARPLMSVLLAGWLNDDALVAAGELPINRLDLAVATVRITFPMAGVLVLFAWGLGVLNSHRRFFLPYVAPVLWNAAIIGGLVFGGMMFLNGAEVVPTETLTRLLFAALIGALVGGLLQFGVLLPGVFREMRGFRLSMSTKVEGVRPALRAFGPVVLGRGAYQLSGYIDTFLAGFLAAGAIAAQGKALMLYILPISLFGMSVAASELPELSRISRERLGAFLDRVRASLGQILYLVVPTAVGYLLFGYLVVGAFFQTGRFGVSDTWLATLVLAGYTLGLLATTATRLLQNAFYALRDTRTPAKIAAGRLAVSAAVGAGLMLVLDRLTVEGVLGVAGEGEADGAEVERLALGASVGAWAELALLVRALRRHAPAFRLPWRRAAEMLGLAALAAVPAGLLQWVLPEGALHVILAAALVVGLYGVVYLGLGHVLGFEEGEAWVGRLLRRWRNRQVPEGKGEREKG